MTSSALWGLLCVLSLVCVAYSAARFVHWAVRVADVLQISPFIVAVIVIGFGTSSPELSIAIFAAFSGNENIALGNAFGSNIINIAVGISAAALCKPLFFHTHQLRADVLLIICISALMPYFLWDMYLSRTEGIVLATIGFVYIGFTLWKAHNTLQGNTITTQASTDGTTPNTIATLQETKHTYNKKPLFFVLCITLFWLVALMISSQVMVDASVHLARVFGVSELIIGLTIVAFGTSLPEVASCIAASIQRQGDIVLGNIVGSCIFNIVFVIPIVAIIAPHHIEPALLTRDTPWLIGFTLMLGGICLRQQKQARLGRLASASILGIWLVYIILLVDII